MLSVLLFVVMLLAFSLGLGTLIYGFITPAENAEVSMRQRVEYGYMGVSGVVVSLVLLYAF